MVKGRGQNSNRNTVKRTAKNGQKISGDEEVAGTMSWCQASRIRGFGMVLNSTGRNGFTTADHVRIDSGWSWIFQIARVTLHDCEVAPRHHKCPHVPFFRCLFDRLPIRISTSDLHHQILRKKIDHIRAYDFGVQFSSNDPAFKNHR